MENSFISGLFNRPTTTANGALSNRSSLSKSLDLFSMGVSADITTKERLILEALTANPIEAIKVVFYMRDCRGGQGNKDSLRVLNKIILEKLSTYDEFMAGYYKLLPYIPEIGSWKDVYQLYGKNQVLDALILEFVSQNITTNGLCAKWFPRQSQFHKDLAKFSNKSVGEIRRLVAANTKVVESAMCSGQWHEINYSHVPSVAFKKYTKAFKKNDSSRFEDFLNKANAGETKVNASVLYPHDLARIALRSRYSSSTEVKSADAQWRNLPNYMTTPMNILPIIDVSGSMSCAVPGTTAQAIDISIGLGLYFAEHNHGEYKDVWINFSDRPTVQKLNGSSLSERVQSLDYNNWGMSTNIQAVFDLIIKTSKNSPENAPKALLIISDMEFNQCGQHTTNYELAKQKFSAAGMEVPLIIFWRVNTLVPQQPVTMYDTNTMLINGYSPAIMKLICEMNTEELSNITPYNMMLKAISKYNYVDSCFN